MQKPSIVIVAALRNNLSTVDEVIAGAPAKNLQMFLDVSETVMGQQNDEPDY